MSKSSTATDEAATHAPVTTHPAVYLAAVSGMTGKASMSLPTAC